MKKMIIALACCLMATNLYAALEKHTIEQLLKIENEIVQKLSESHITSSKKNDKDTCEYLMGLYFLAYRRVTPELTIKLRDAAIIQDDGFEEHVIGRCLQVDPNNKLAWLLKAEREGISYCGEHKMLYEDMENLVEYANKEQLDKLLLTDTSELWLVFMKNKHPEYLEKDENGRYRIFLDNVHLEYDEAMKLLQDYLDKKYASAYETVLHGQKNDPDNAFYYYLLANMYLVRGLEQDAINQFYLAERNNVNLYADERQRLVVKLANSLSLSEEAKNRCLFSKEMSFEGWSEIFWGNDLGALIDTCEKRGDVLKAKEYAEMGIRLLDKIPERDRSRFPGKLKPEYLKKLERINKINTTH